MKSILHTMLETAFFMLTLLALFIWAVQQATGVNILRELLR